MIKFNGFLNCQIFDKSSIQFSFSPFIKSSSISKMKWFKSASLFFLWHSRWNFPSNYLSMQKLSYLSNSRLEKLLILVLTELFLLFSIVSRDCKTSDGNLANSIVSYHRRRLEIFSIRFPFSLPCAFNCCKKWEGNEKGWYFELFHFHFPLHLLFVRWGEKKQRKLLRAYRINYRWK